MRFNKLKSFRTFIFLLIAVFFADTVYASGMMLADQLPTNHASTSEHCIQPTTTNAHSDHHKHDTQQKQSNNDHCSKCSHCMACLTVLPPSQLDNMQSQVQATAISLFESSYLSHVSAHPQRPPIS